MDGQKLNGHGVYLPIRRERVHDRKREKLEGSGVAHIPSQ